jgi:hypothetical protein
MSFFIKLFSNNNAKFASYSLIISMITFCQKIFPIILIALGFAAGPQLSAQSRQPVQISGLVITNDSIPQYVPYAHVFVREARRGTMTSEEGFFSFAALPGDTIRVSCVGFKTEKLKVPDSLNDDAYLARVVLKRDTTILQEVVLYPWPTKERFKQEFLATRIPTTQNDIAMRNLAIEELKSQAAAMGYNADEIADFALQAQAQQIYDYGRYQGFENGASAILGSFTNPLAWQQLFQSFKKGK